MDDFYGASKRGVQITGSVVLRWLADLVGRPVEPTKNVDQKHTIIVLEAKVIVDFHEWCVRAGVDNDKAKHWRSPLEELVATKTHQIVQAGSRLQWRSTSVGGHTCAPSTRNHTRHYMGSV